MSVEIASVHTQPHPTRPPPVAIVDMPEARAVRLRMRLTRRRPRQPQATDHGQDPAAVESRPQPVSSNPTTPLPRAPEGPSSDHGHHPTPEPSQSSHRLRRPRPEAPEPSPDDSHTTSAAEPRNARLLSGLLARRRRRRRTHGPDDTASRTSEDHNERSSIGTTEENATSDTRLDMHSDQLTETALTLDDENTRPPRARERRSRTARSHRTENNDVPTVYTSGVDIALFLYTVIAVAATVVVLSKEWSVRCDQPLQMWLAVNAVLTALHTALKYAAGPQTPPSMHGTVLQRILAWTYRCVSTALLAWFFVGFSLAFPSKTCQETAHATYKLAIVFAMLELLVIGVTAVLVTFVCVVEGLLPRSVFTSSSIRNPSRGASPQDLTKLKPIKYSPELLPDEGDRVCSICLADYVDGDIIHILPCPGNGTHAFHASCVQQWLSRDRSCPVCKHDFTTNPSPPSTAR